MEPVMFKLRAFLAMNICIAACAASATTYYVDYDAGSDGNDGLSMSTAFKTVKHALDLEGLKDDEIVLKSGTHHLNGAPLVKNVYCTIRGETGNPADVTIDADGLSECARFVGANGKRLGIPMRVIGITFRNGAAPTGNSSVACCLNIDGNVIASNCVVTANIEAGETALENPPVYVKDALLVDCVVSNNAVRGYCTAVQLGSTGIGICRGCLLTDNRATSNVGGPIYAPAGGEIVDTVVSNNVSLINAGVYGAPNLISGCTFVTNQISITQRRETGVVTIRNLNASKPDITVITNCTIAGNYCASQSSPTCAGVRIDGQSCLMVDCVVSNNISRGNTGMDAQATDGETVTIAGCTFAGNTAKGTSCGGAYFGTGVTVTNCAFIGNTAPQGGGGVYGAGFTMVDCTLSNNVANVGGGVCVCTNDDGIATISGTLFVDNEAKVAGGGLSVGFLNKTSNAYTNGYATVTGCTFLQNRALTGGSTDFPGGGAVYMTTAGKSSGFFDRCVFKDNASKTYGGAFHVRDASSTAVGVAPVTVRNSLFVGNKSTGGTASACLGGAMYLVKSDPMVVENCTFDGNEADGGNSDIHIRWSGVHVRNSIFNTPNFESHNIYQTAMATNCVNAATLPEKLSANRGNFAADPRLVDAANGDYSLTPASPCRNVASVQPWMATATDLAGNPRVLQDLPDLGAYELWIEPGTMIIFK